MTELLIAVDAMGGDFAPAETVAGTVLAARTLPGLSSLILVGDEPRVRAELEKHRPLPDSIEVRHAAEVVTMDEAPAVAVRQIGRAHV